MYDKILLYNLTLGYRDVAHCTKKGKTVKTFFFFLMKPNVVNILMRRPKQIRLWARGDHFSCITQRYTKCMRFTKCRYGRCHRHGGRYRVLTRCNNLHTIYICIMYIVTLKVRPATAASYG